MVTRHTPARAAPIMVTTLYAVSGNRRCVILRDPSAG
jgi:hypothetical protein